MEVQDYFNNGRNSDKRELKLTKEAIEKASDLFPNAVLQNRWPYELSDGEKIEIPFEKSAPRKRRPKRSYSHSTNAMILFSLIASSGQAAAKCPLIPNVTLIDPFDFLSNKSIYDTVWKKLKSQLKNELNETSNEHMSYSTTFGVNDPLTLSWLIEIERSNVFAGIAKKDNIKNDLINIANLQIKRILKNQSSNSGRMPDWLIWGEDKQRYSIDHGFLALRFVQLIKSLDALQGNPHDGGSNWFTQYFHNRIHEQLSKYEIRDGDFDAAELVFALEGLLLLKPLSISRALLDRLFHVITESQNRNPYWRPVKPIVATPQGRVLFPLSVETASSLLRCCSLIEDSHNDPFFSQNVDLFRRYSEWLCSRISSGTAKYPNPNGRHKTVPFCGWHSEHVHIHPGIHLWETANVLLYFHYYSLMLEKHIAEKSLEAAHLNEEYPWTKKPKSIHIEYWTGEERKTIEPIYGTYDKKLQPYRFAEKHIILPRTPDKHQKQFQDEMAFSIVLYGPPGTGKTLFAEEICKALTWPLVTVTPSDFILGGESEVEARAKIIFEVLEDQFNKIILLDEIDRMIIDRSSEGYARQGDFFQFMTPSMLTKLRNLRKKKRIIFIIATNYKERIDPAAIRKGRIDAHLLMSPPNKEGRIEFFKQLILRKIADETAKNYFLKKSHKILDEIANLTGLNTYSEIAGLFDEAIAGLTGDEKTKYKKIVEKIKSLLSNNAGTKNISLTSYKSRFETSHSDPKGDPFPQKPFLEFFLLVFIKIETGSDLDDKEQEILKIALQKFAEKEDKDWKPTNGELPKLKKRLKSYFPEIKGLILKCCSKFESILVKAYKT